MAETIPYSDQAEKATAKSDVIGSVDTHVASRPASFSLYPSLCSPNGKKVNETSPPVFTRIQLTAELATMCQARMNSKRT